MNTPVNFPLAKLLKEKGFDELCDTYNDGISNVTLYPKYKSSTIPQSLYQYALVCVPTIAEVIMWLYEKHGIWISPTHQYNQFFCRFGSYQTQDFNSPTEAYEAAIEYTLNNLI